MKVIAQKLPNGEPVIIDVPLPDGPGDYVITTLGGAATRIRAGAVETPPFFGQAPQILGPGAPGTELVLSLGVVGGVPMPEVSVRWLEDGRPIAGETGYAYRVRAEDRVDRLEAEVELRNRLGVSRRRARAGEVGRAPFFLSRVAIEGDARPGRIVSASFAAPGGTQPVAVLYEWRQGADVVGGERALVVPDAPWDVLSLRVTLRNPFGAVVDAAAPVQIRALPSASVSIGPEDVRPGQTLQILSLTTSNLDGALAYQWLRDGAPIAGAEGESYTLVWEDQERSLALRLMHPEIPEGVTSNAVTGLAVEAAEPEPPLISQRLAPSLDAPMAGERLSDVRWQPGVYEARPPRTIPAGGVEGVVSLDAGDPLQPLVEGAMVRLTEIVTDADGNAVVFPGPAVAVLPAEAQQDLPPDAFTAAGATLEPVSSAAGDEIDLVIVPPLPDNNGLPYIRAERIWDGQDWSQAEVIPFPLLRRHRLTVPAPGQPTSLWIRAVNGAGEGEAYRTNAVTPIASSATITVDVDPLLGPLTEGQRVDASYSAARGTSSNGAPVAVVPQFQIDGANVARSAIAQAGRVVRVIDALSAAGAASVQRASNQVTVAALPAVDEGIAQGVMASSMSFEGITMTFDRAVPTGFDAAGLPWAVSGGQPLRVVAIDPPCTGTGTSLKGGAMLNPGNCARAFPGQDVSDLGKRQMLNWRGPRRQGYTGARAPTGKPEQNYEDYDPSLNVHPSVSGPLSLHEGTIVVSRTQGTSARMHAPVPLTILRARPHVDSILPGPARADKTPRVRVRDIDLSRIPRRAPLPGVTLPSFETVIHMLRFRHTDETTFQVQGLNTVGMGEAADPPGAIHGFVLGGGYPSSWGNVLASAITFLVYAGWTDEQRRRVLVEIARHSEWFVARAEEGGFQGYSNGGHAVGRLNGSTAMAVATGKQHYIDHARMSVVPPKVPIHNNIFQPQGLSIFGEAGQLSYVTPALIQASAGGTYFWPAAAEGAPAFGSDEGAKALSTRNMLLNLNTGSGAGYEHNSARTRVAMALHAAVIPGWGAVMRRADMDLICNYADRYIAGIADGIWYDVPSTPGSLNHRPGAWHVAAYQRDVPQATRWRQSAPKARPVRDYGPLPTPTTPSTGGSGGGSGGTGAEGQAADLSVRAYPLPVYPYDVMPAWDEGTAWVFGTGTPGAIVEARGQGASHTTAWAETVVRPDGTFACPVRAPRSAFLDAFTPQIRHKGQATVVAGARKFAYGTVVGDMGQSETAFVLRNGSTYHKMPTADVIVEQDHLAAMYVTPENNDGGGFEAIPVTQATANARRVNPAMVARANQLRAAGAGYTLFVDMAWQGTARSGAYNDADTSRVTQYLRDVVRWLRDWNNEMGLVVDCWANADHNRNWRFGPEHAAFYMSEHWDGSAFTLGDRAKGPTSTAPVTLTLWDVGAPMDQRGQGLFARARTKLALMESMPLHGMGTERGPNFTTGAGTGFQATRLSTFDRHRSAADQGYRRFLADPRVRTFALQDAGSGHYVQFGVDGGAVDGGDIHPSSVDPAGMVRYAQLLAWPAVNRRFGMVYREPRLLGVDSVSADGRTLRVAVGSPGGGRITTDRLLRALPVPANNPPQRLGVVGFELQRAGESDGQRRALVRPGSAGEPSWAQATAAIVNDGDASGVALVEIVFSDPVAPGARLHYLRGPATAHQQDADKRARLYEDMLIEHLPEFYAATTKWPFVGVPVQAHPDPARLVVPAWGTTGAVDRSAYTGQPPAPAVGGSGAGTSPGGGSGGSGGGDSGGSGSDTTSPTITSVSVGTGLRPLIVAQTSEPVRLGTSSSDTGRFRRASDGVDQQVFTLGDGVLSIVEGGFTARPAADLTDGQAYALRMSTAMITDLAGNRLSLVDFTVATFTAQAPAVGGDTTPPKITGVRVINPSEIRIDHDEAVFDNGGFIRLMRTSDNHEVFKRYLDGRAGAGITPGSIEIAGATIVVRPESALAADAYAYRPSPSAYKDAAGNAVVAPTNNFAFPFEVQASSGGTTGPAPATFTTTNRVGFRSPNLGGSRMRYRILGTATDLSGYNRIFASKQSQGFDILSLAPGSQMRIVLRDSANFNPAPGGTNPVVNDFFEEGVKHLYEVEADLAGRTLRAWRDGVQIGGTVQLEPSSGLFAGNRPITLLNSSVNNTSSPIQSGPAGVWDYAELVIDGVVPANGRVDGANAASHPWRIES